MKALEDENARLKKLLAESILNEAALRDLLGNVQCENLAPVDEAEAFAELARNGVSLDDIAAETGKSTDTMTRRLAIAGLCDEVKQALREKTLSYRRLPRS